MTIEEMVEVLSLKGYSRDYAESRARLDSAELEKLEINWDTPKYECSVCRRTFSDLAWTYHYHPCE